MPREYSTWKKEWHLRGPEAKLVAKLCGIRHIYYQLAAAKKLDDKTRIKVAVSEYVMRRHFWGHKCTEVALCHESPHPCCKSKRYDRFIDSPAERTHILTAAHICRVLGVSLRHRKHIIATAKAIEAIVMLATI